MDTEKCRAYLEVVATGNIRKAAARLEYTPSGLSRMMASLEKDLGLTLLERSRRGVRPTSTGRELIPSLKRVVAAASACEENARSLLGLESGHVSIGIAYPQLYGALTEVLSGFRNLHPGVRIGLREANSTPLAHALDAGELDFAIMSERPGDFAWQPIVDDTLVALVPAAHPLAHAESYPLERFEQDPYVDIGPGEDTDNALAFRRLGIEPNTCYAVSLDSAGYEMVSAGLGVTLTNAIHARSHTGAGGAVTLPTEPELHVSIGIAHVERALATPAARAFSVYATPRLAEAADHAAASPGLRRHSPAHDAQA